MLDYRLLRTAKLVEELEAEGAKEAQKKDAKLHGKLMKERAKGAEKLDEKKGGGGSW